jgi:hypothetical protein
MSPSARVHPEIDLVLRIYPAETASVRRLYLSDPEFRSICEDYALARATVSRLEHGSAGTPGPAVAEIVEYRTLIAALESELGHYLTQAKGDQAPRAGGRGAGREVS